MSTAPTDRVRDHWYWRPGWAVGRRFYTWHLAFADQPEVTALADRYREALEDCAVVDPIPSRWLHLTMQGLGFIDEVSEQDAHRVADAARTRCARLAPFDLTIGDPYVDPESVQIAVRPAAPVRLLRLAIRDAIAEVWGAARVPEPEDSFNPHMSLGYTNANASAAPLRQAIDGIVGAPATATIGRCDLIILHRDDQTYEWEGFAAAELRARKP
jgi:2'-5' RNA ligase